VTCRVTEYQRQQWRLQEEQRAAEQREKQRIASLQNQWAQVTTARANAVLAGYQQRAYIESVQRLFALDAHLGCIGRTSQ